MIFLNKMANTDKIEKLKREYPGSAKKIDRLVSAYESLIEKRRSKAETMSLKIALGIPTKTPKQIVSKQKKEDKELKAEKQKQEKILKSEQQRQKKEIAFASKEDFRRKLEEKKQTLKSEQFEKKEERALFKTQTSAKRDITKAQTQLEKQKLATEKQKLAKKKFEVKQKEKSSKKWKALKKKLSKTVKFRKITRPSKTTVTIKERKPTNIFHEESKFFKSELDKTKRDMFFS